MLKKLLKFLLLCFLICLPTLPAFSQQASSLNAVQVTQSKASTKQEVSQSNSTKTSSQQDYISSNLWKLRNLSTSQLDLLTNHYINNPNELKSLLLTVTQQYITLYDCSNDLTESREKVAELQSSIQVIETNLEAALKENTQSRQNILDLNKKLDLIEKEALLYKKKFNLGSGVGMCFGGLSGSALAAGVGCFTHREWAAGASCIGGSVILFSTWAICHFAFKLF